MAAAALVDLPLKAVAARSLKEDNRISTLRGFEDTIFSQDQRVVESQRPEQVPFDLADELHLKFHAVAINFRRAMQQQLAYTHHLDIAP